MIDFDLSAGGDPLSKFMQACAGRRVDLGGVKPGPHPLQLIPARWRTLKMTLEAFVDELASVENSYDPAGEMLLRSFRQLIYDATELLESYANLVASRVDQRNKVNKLAVIEFKKTAKRLRDPHANLCNRCKHEGAQLRFLWAKSPSTGRTGGRILVSVYRKAGLLRDDDIHKGKMAGMGLVRLGQEITHDLLRMDNAAGLLIEKLADSDCEPMTRVSPELPVGAAMRKIASLVPTRHADEALLHNGIVFKDSILSLVRVPAESFGPTTNIATSLTVEAGTTTYSIA